MSKMDTKEELIEILEDLKENRISYDEVLTFIRQKIPPEVQYIEKPLKSTKKQLDYQKEYTIQRKKYRQLSKKVNKKEAIKELKVQKAKERTSFFCFKCKEAVKVDSTKNNITFKRKRGYNQDKIIISNHCPLCGNITKSFGGILEIF